jgi:hypothetical protein
MSARRLLSCIALAASFALPTAEALASSGIAQVAFTYKDDIAGQNVTDPAINAEVDAAFATACGARLAGPVRFNPSIYERPTTPGTSVVSLALYVKHRNEGRVVYAFHQEDYTALETGGTGSEDLEYDAVPASELKSEVGRLVRKAAEAFCGVQPLTR